jgi:LmbE family N-acetylglucosaminyl deacetylase
MKLAAPLALALCLATASAQTPQFTDPANLRGERVNPRDGRELPIDQGALGLQQLLRKLNTRASILNIVAHPDDEDGGMLTFYARGLGARVADLSLTRGEGGQNAMTGDFEDALGLLRTQELLANDRYTGVDQMFGTEVDFGFSKTKEEAFAKWTHDRVLYDAVRAIRLYRPLVITATFIGGVTDGHGQHQVSGQIAQEAFKAAGDPTVFPDMIAEGILPWQPLKVYARVPTQSITAQGLYDYATNQFTPARFTNYVTGEVTTTPPSADVIVHEGTPDPLLATTAAKPSDLSSAMAKQTTPLSYIQFARIGLGLQKSQIDAGFHNAPSGIFDVAYHLYGSALPHASGEPLKVPEINQVGYEDSTFFKGIDTSIESIADFALDTNAAPMNLRKNLALLQADITSAQELFTPGRPQTTVPPLASALSLLDKLIQNVDLSSLAPEQKHNILHELRTKRVQLNDAMVLALGLAFEATTHGIDQPVASRPVISSKLSTTTEITLTVEHEWLVNSENTINKMPNQNVEERHPELAPGRSFIRTLNTLPTFTYAVTRPYFERKNLESAVYHLSNPALCNAPAAPPAMTAWATVEFRGLDVELGRIVHDGAQFLDFVPAVSVALEPQAEVLPNQIRMFDLHARIVLMANNPLLKQIDKQPGKPQIVTGKLNLQTPPGWIVHPAMQPLGDIKPSFSIKLPTAPGAGPFILTAKASAASGEQYMEGYRPVGYISLPRTNYYTSASTRIVPVDLNLPTHHKLAYIPGTGDAVPAALTSLGLTPTVLTVADLIPTNLAQYDTIILGVRTYNAHPNLHGAPTQALLDYAKNGGNVVVQYQTAEFTAADAPYPLSLGSNEKVVDETAPVQLLQPDSSILTLPNKITPADFNHWIEERGHGFLSTWDPHYTALTETHDPGGPETKAQEPQRGGLITTQLGKGRWTYVAFALYRQLPEAVPGAYRIFMNLIEP